MKKAQFTTMAAVVALGTAFGSTPAGAQGAGDQLIGQLLPVGFNFCPRSFARADGQLLSIAQNTALFSLYGTNFGGDGRTTFALPDLRGRSPIHYGQGPGLSSYFLGQRSGAESVTLSVNEMPTHNHVATVNVSRTNATTRSPVNAYFARTDSTTLAYEENTAPTGDTMAGSTVGVGTAGGSQAHNNLSPYLAINWCVALQGIFPSRS